MLKLFPEKVKAIGDGSVGRAYLKSIVSLVKQEMNLLKGLEPTLIELKVIKI